MCYRSREAKHRSNGHSACCNTWFTEGHKPSNHIRARIKSHIYTTEWIVCHSTYHVKIYKKASTNVIYYINEKMSDTKRKHKTSTKLWSWAPQGRRLGDNRLEVLILLVALGKLVRVGRNWAAVECPQKEQEEKCRGGKCEYTTRTQQVYHKLWGSKVGWHNCISF